jgi:hypothetical protein
MYAKAAPEWRRSDIFGIGAHRRFEPFQWLKASAMGAAANIVRALSCSAIRDNHVTIPNNLPKSHFLNDVATTNAKLQRYFSYLLRG